MKRYILTVLLQLDELLSALTGGYAEETISYRMSINAAEGQFIGCIFCRVVEWFIPDHCDLHAPSKSVWLSRGTIE